jgi:antitoxin component YwqK of YwqJK toxin-antitoxin module
MEEKYANGQIISRLQDGVLTYYLKDGKLKARGPFVDGMMEGDWTFWRASGELWQTGQFLHNQKHGRFIRYDRAGKVEYDEVFDKGKLIRRA